MGTKPRRTRWLEGHRRGARLLQTVLQLESESGPLLRGCWLALAGAAPSAYSRKEEWTPRYPRAPLAGCKAEQPRGETPAGFSAVLMVQGGPDGDPRTSLAFPGICVPGGPATEPQARSPLSPPAAQMCTTVLQSAEPLDGYPKTPFSPLFF